MDRNPQIVLFMFRCVGLYDVNVAAVGYSATAVVYAIEVVIFFGFVVLSYGSFTAVSVFFLSELSEAEVDCTELLDRAADEAC